MSTAEAQLLTTPEQLAYSYKLRYQVYCLDRHYLDSADYPKERETDQYDHLAIHLGVYQCGELVASLRLLPHALVCRQHWTIRVPTPIAEASRLVTCRGLSNRQDVLLALYSGLFEQARDGGFQTLVFGADPSLARLLHRYFNVRRIGGPRQYIGPPVSLYALDVTDALDRLQPGRLAA